MQRREFVPFKRHRLVFHGLRKSAVVFLVEAGCTTAEVSAITGQSLQMVEHYYAEQVNQRSWRGPPSSSGLLARRVTRITYRTPNHAFFAAFNPASLALLS